MTMSSWLQLILTLLMVRIQIQGWFDTELNSYSQLATSNLLTLFMLNLSPISSQSSCILSCTEKCVSCIGRSQ